MHTSSSTDSHFIRFVNGFIEPVQKGNFAQSVNVLAERIGLPRSLVDLRHESTHDQLPSIHILRSAALEVDRIFSPLFLSSDFSSISAVFLFRLCFGCKTTIGQDSTSHFMKQGLGFVHTVETF